MLELAFCVEKIGVRAEICSPKSIAALAEYTEQFWCVGAIHSKYR